MIIFLEIIQNFEFRYLLHHIKIICALTNFWRNRLLLEFYVPWLLLHGMVPIKFLSTLACVSVIALMNGTSPALFSKRLLHPANLSLIASTPWQLQPIAYCQPSFNNNNNNNNNNTHCSTTNVSDYFFNQ